MFSLASLEGMLPIHFWREIDTATIVFTMRCWRGVRKVVGIRREWEANDFIEWSNKWEISVNDNALTFPLFPSFPAQSNDYMYAMTDWIRLNSFPWQWNSFLHFSYIWCEGGFSMPGLRSVPAVSKLIFA